MSRTSYLLVEIASPPRGLTEDPRLSSKWGGPDEDSSTPTGLDGRAFDIQLSQGLERGRLLPRLGFGKFSPGLHELGIQNHITHPSTMHGVVSLRGWCTVSP